MEIVVVHYSNGTNHSSIAIRSNRTEQLFWCDYHERLEGTEEALVKVVHTYDDNTLLICSDSYRRILTRCPVCASYAKKTDMLFDNNTDLQVCPDCIDNTSICPHCAGVYRKPRREYLLDGQPVCLSCYRSHPHCDECRNAFTEEIPLIHEYGEYRCSDCNDGYNGYYSWRYRPKSFKHFGNSKDFLIGIENEVALANENHLLTRELFQKAIDEVHSHDRHGAIYCMHDGTIDCGFEIVTHPMSFEFFKTEFDPKALLPTAVRNSYTTGMHVHISRKIFNEYSLYRFMHFIINNPDFIERIAKRPPGGEHQWRLTPEGDLVDKAKGADYTDKYVDVNTKHVESIEVRIFKGALTPADVYAAVEFVVALSLFVTTEPEIDDNEYFSKFVWKNKQTFPYINRRIRLITKTKSRGLKPLKKDEFEKSKTSEEDSGIDPMTRARFLSALSDLDSYGPITEGDA